MIAASFLYPLPLGYSLPAARSTTVAPGEQPRLGWEHPSCSTAQRRTKNSARTDGKAWAWDLALLARKARTKKGLLGSSCEPDNRKA